MVNTFLLEGLSRTPRKGFWKLTRGSLALTSQGKRNAEIHSLGSAGPGGGLDNTDKGAQTSQKPPKAQGAVKLRGAPGPLLGWGGGRLGLSFPRRESEPNERTEMDTGAPVSSAYTAWKGAEVQHKDLLFSEDKMQVGVLSSNPASATLCP